MRRLGRWVRGVTCALGGPRRSLSGRPGADYLFAVKGTPISRATDICCGVSMKHNSAQAAPDRRRCVSLLLIHGACTLSKESPMVVIPSGSHLHPGSNPHPGYLVPNLACSLSGYART